MENKALRDITRVKLLPIVDEFGVTVKSIEGYFKSGEKYTIATFDRSCGVIAAELVEIINEKCFDEAEHAKSAVFNQAEYDKLYGK